MVHLADALNPQVLHQQLTAARERNKYLEDMCAKMNAVMLLLVPPNSPRSAAVFEGYAPNEMPPAEVMAERIERQIKGVPEPAHANHCRPTIDARQPPRRCDFDSYERWSGAMLDYLADGMSELVSRS